MVSEGIHFGCMAGGGIHFRIHFKVHAIWIHFGMQVWIQVLAAQAKQVSVAQSTPQWTMEPAAGESEVSINL